MKTLTVDDSICIGCGICAASYSNNFDLDSNTGLSKVISQDDVTDDMAEICPVGAIKVNEVEKNCECGEECQCEGNCECHND